MWGEVGDNVSVFAAYLPVSVHPLSFYQCTLEAFLLKSSRRNCITYFVPCIRFAAESRDGERDFSLIHRVNTLRISLFYVRPKLFLSDRQAKMGGCQSTTRDETPPPSSSRQPAHHHDIHDDGHGAARPSQQHHVPRRRDPNNNNSHIESLVRVGSKVLKESDLPNSKLLQVARASTYDHLHANVITGFLDYSRRDSSLGIVGLRNVGNTCYMNSAIQCLSNTIPLADYFLGYDYRNEINYNSVLGTKGQLVNAYTKLMKQLWLSSNTASVDPSFFHSALVKFAPDFYGNEQHDAQELLAFLLDGIHEDLNRVQSKPYVEDVVGDGTNNEGLAVLAWQNYLTRDRSIVVDLFQGQLLNTIVCGTCHSTKVKFEPFMYLSLPISKSTRTTLEDCLQLYCQVEQLSGENQWYCGKCEKHVNATKKLDLWMLPPILIIHLKRFTSTGNKIDSCIQYPLCNWNVPTKSTSTSSDTTNPNTFDLYAISHHSGGLQGGHYTATVKNRFNDDWYEMNDSQTRRVDRISNRDSRAYCLFYNRVDTSSNGKSAKIMRQSVNRPELWPHMQLNTDNVTSFRRSTIVKSMPPPPPSPTVNGGDNVQVTADMAAISEESALEA